MFRSTAYSTDYGVFEILVKRVIMIFFSPFFNEKILDQFVKVGVKLTWETTQKPEKANQLLNNIRKIESAVEG